MASNLIRDKFTELRFALRAALGCRPVLYFALQALRPRRRHLLVTRDTEIVIEGYPRSANTFAVAAFLLAQGRRVKIARHLHVPAQVIQAVRWGIPTIVLIRNPEDAVPSLLVREHAWPAEQALKDYIRFYSRVAPYQHGFVLATFEEVTQHFGAVIERVNRRFSTNFVVFEHTEENVKRVFKLVEKMDKEDQGRTSVTETTVARPSKVREELKKQRRREMDTYAHLLEQARMLYENMLRRESR